jgi:hypothetical protein
VREVSEVSEDNSTLSEADRSETVALVMRAGGLGRGLNTLMDRPRTTSSTEADRSGVQMFLQKRSSVPVPSPATTPNRVGQRVLSPTLWVLDSLLILTAVSVLFVPGFDRSAALVLGCWLITLAAGVGVLAIIGRR